LSAPPLRSRGRCAGGRRTIGIFLANLHPFSPYTAYLIYSRHTGTLFRHTRHGRYLLGTPHPLSPYTAQSVSSQHTGTFFRLTWHGHTRHKSPHMTLASKTSTTNKYAASYLELYTDDVPSRPPTATPTVDPWEANRQLNLDGDQHACDQFFGFQPISAPQRPAALSEARDTSPLSNNNGNLHQIRSHNRPAAFWPLQYFN
jgi:hypothetical protein